MRHIVFVFYALFFGFLLTACGGHPAEKAAVSFYTALFNGETEKAILLSTLGDSIDNNEYLKGIYGSKMKAVVAEAIKQKGGFQKVKVDSKSPSKISENSATVYLIFYFGDGTREKEKVLVKKVNNQWKVAL